MKRLLVLIAALPSIANAAEPNAVAYQLQERCGKRAEEVHGIDHTSRIVQSHYNIRLNKCFSIERVVGLPLKFLFDVSSGEAWATFSSNGDNVIQCVVDDKQCHSLREWDELVRPYMEE